MQAGQAQTGSLFRHDSVCIFEAVWQCLQQQRGGRLCILYHYLASIPIFLHPAHVRHFENHSVPAGISGASYYEGSFSNIQRSPAGDYVAVSSRGNFFLTWSPGQTYWQPHNRPT